LQTSLLEVAFFTILDWSSLLEGIGRLLKLEDPAPECAVGQCLLYLYIQISDQLPEKNAPVWIQTHLVTGATALPLASNIEEHIDFSLVDLYFFVGRANLLHPCAGPGLGWMLRARAQTARRILSSVPLVSLIHKRHT
jgi:hypothetical protein